MPKNPLTEPVANLRLDPSPRGLDIFLSGRLDSHGVALVWDQATKAARDARHEVSIDLSGVDYLDGAGAALLTRLALHARENQARFTMQGLAPDFQAMVDMYDMDALDADSERKDECSGLITGTGRLAAETWSNMRDLVAFVGEASYALFSALLHPGRVRWKDVITTCEKAGFNALPIIALMGFLIGLIMAFQSAIPLQRFGADIYVADFLGIALSRELGPLITAILLTGRSGSAFAAEIGTMKVNEEVNALITMGLNPVRFLAVPRVLGAVLVTPVLTVFFNLFALVGGALVIRSFGYPVTTYLAHVQNSTHTGDVLGGLFKAMVFAVLVAGIGCQRGLNTAKGASAVGESTTSSVVSGLVLITVSDGIMAVIFYALGI
ncbi:MAG: MlaE family lipid ABC transporter permease subunit [Desulfovibrio sp.]|nr:MAG: MlaE family lipid ABC transporter permease subunit [Desulfovibrio sp.]